jgi:hypothetical protein
VPKTNKTQWKKAKTHDVTLDSGAEVTIQIPQLAELLKAGDVPNHLVPFATSTAKQLKAGEAIEKEQIDGAADFIRYLVAKTVVVPEITEADVPDLPGEDVDMLFEFATRQRDLDALGKHIAGLDLQKDFRTFRRLPGGAEADGDQQGER